METTNDEGFARNVKDYVEVQFKLAELQLIEKTAASGSVLISKFVISMAVFVALLFFSLALGYGLYQLVGSLVISLLIVGGIYLLMALLFVLFKQQILLQPLRNSIVKSLTQNDLP